MLKWGEKCLNVDLEDIISKVYTSKYNRENVFSGEFKNVFYRFIGVENTNNYNNILKKIQKKVNENIDVTIVFDNSIDLLGEMELIEYIYKEIENMDVYNISKEQINILNNIEINNKFLKALEYVCNLSINNENFFSESVRNNFITKLIVWGYSYLRNINFDKEINPKCIYYGDIERHSIYFLILLYLMGFDVIYINPLKEEFFNEIDRDNLSKCIKYLNILSVESFDYRASKGEDIEKTQTITKQIQKDIQDTFFSDIDIFKAWQFRGGYTKSILLDTILEDIYTYFSEPAKLREGFKVDKDINTVKIPCFFYKIDGEYKDILNYQKLVKYCVENSDTLFFNTGYISKDENFNDDMYKLMFLRLGDGTFDIDGIKKLPIYKFSKYSEETQNFLLKKFNETILDKSLFTKPLKDTEILKLLSLVLSLNDLIVRHIDNFDFTSNIPKIVIYLDGENVISDSMVMILAYIHKIGLDIIIFNPSGLRNLVKIIRNDRFNYIRLEKMEYESKYKKLMLTKNIKGKVGAISKFFKF